MGEPGQHHPCKRGIMYVSVESMAGWHRGYGRLRINYRMSFLLTISYSSTLTYITVCERVFCSHVCLCSELSTSVAYVCVFVCTHLCECGSMHTMMYIHVEVRGDPP